MNFIKKKNGEAGKRPRERKRRGEGDRKENKFEGENDYSEK